MFDATHVVCQAPMSCPRIRIVACRPLAYYRGERGARRIVTTRWTVLSKLDAVVMGKQMIPNLIYLGALSLLVCVFTLVLLIAAATLFIPSNVAFASGVSARSFTIAAVSFFIAVAVAAFLFARALQRRRLD